MGEMRRISQRARGRAAPTGAALARIIPAMSYMPPAALVAAAEDFGVPQALYVPRFLPGARADELLADTLAGVDWQHERVTLFGRTFTARRLSACYGDPTASYGYSGLVRRALPWTERLRTLAAEVAAAVGSRFNFVLINRFRDGGDRLGWHADDEADLGPRPVIASLSVGAERVFRMRPKAGGASIGRVLGHGSLVLMWGTSQRDFRHAVPPTARPVGERLNFTFRWTRAELLGDGV